MLLCKKTGNRAKIHKKSSLVSANPYEKGGKGKKPFLPGRFVV